jgi:hypothetical protein
MSLVSLVPFSPLVAERWTVDDTKLNRVKQLNSKLGKLMRSIDRF